MISLFISTGSTAVIPRHVGKFGHIGPFSQILPEIADSRAKQTLYTSAAVPAGLAFDRPPPSTYAGAGEASTSTESPPMAASSRILYA